MTSVLQLEITWSSLLPVSYDNQQVRHSHLELWCDIQYPQNDDEKFCPFLQWNILKNKQPQCLKASLLIWCRCGCFHIKPTLIPVFVLPDLWDDLHHGAVLRDPQQPGVLKRLLAMKEGRAGSPRLILFLSFHKQELSRILLAGFSQLFEKTT